MSAKFSVGQTVFVYDVNMRGEPQTATVTKVGRTLVTVQGGYWTKTYRIEDGRANDNYGHSWILTADEQATRERKNAAIKTLAEAGVTLTHLHRLTVGQIEALTAIVTTEAGA